MSQIQETYRNDAYGFDAYVFDNGLKIQVYDDGRVKVGGKNKSVSVHEVGNWKTGARGPHAHVVMQFRQTVVVEAEED